MNNNLFANVEDKKEAIKAVKTYESLMENRQRPAMPDEPVTYEVADEKELAEAKRKSPKRDLQMYPNELVKQ
ncbi:MAG: hypothetical protein R2764_03575 [Bacteroidales bacterium]